ncbi:MAG: hypothetical protein UMU75_10830 [Halomonas sp.]|nr:hypothetical protein [Halomonas sp.]
MIAEPQRSYYLDAMGLTAWVSRYRLPNAAETPACEWLEPEIPPERPPAQRLQALLEKEAPVVAADSATSAPVRHQKRARGLLESEGVMAPESQAPVVAASHDTVTQEVDRPVHESLRFTLQVAALDGRWLVILPGERALGDMGRKLLGNLLQAAGIVPRAAPVFQEYRWPLVEGMPAESPLEEACEGLRAFIDGQHRRGWRPERVLVFGEDSTLARVLAIEEGRCGLLGLVGWQGPGLTDLAESAELKRELWRTLGTWQEAWHQAADEATDSSLAESHDADT